MIENIVASLVDLGAFKVIPSSKESYLIMIRNGDLKALIESAEYDRVIDMLVKKTREILWNYKPPHGIFSCENEDLMFSMPVADRLGVMHIAVTEDGFIEEISAQDNNYSSAITNVVGIFNQTFGDPFIRCMKEHPYSRENEKIARLGGIYLRDTISLMREPGTSNLKIGIKGHNSLINLDKEFEDYLKTYRHLIN